MLLCYRGKYVADCYGLGASESSFRRPMAALGGLVTSTLLRLLVISVAFIYMDDVKVWVLRLFGKPKRPSFDEHEAVKVGLKKPALHA